MTAMGADGRIDVEVIARAHVRSEHDKHWTGAVGAVRYQPSDQRAIFPEMHEQALSPETGTKCSKAGSDKEAGFAETWAVRLPTNREVGSFDK
jgi:hypothetical protein